MRTREVRRGTLHPTSPWAEAARSHLIMREAREAPVMPRISDSGPLALCEAHFDVGAVGQGRGVDEAHLSLLQRNDQRLCADAFAEKTYTAQEVSVGYACAREDELFSRRQVFGLIDALAIFD